MEITRKVNDMTISIGLTAAEVEMAYRAQRHMYRMEDAERYCNAFCDTNGIEALFTDEAEADKFYNMAAERFGDEADENRKNNEVWTEVIEHCVTKMLLPGWKSGLIDMAAKDTDTMTDMLNFITGDLNVVPEQAGPIPNDAKGFLLSLLGPMELYPALDVVKRFIWKED